MEEDIIDSRQQEAYQNLIKNNKTNENKKSQRLDGILGTVLEKIAETTNSKDSRSKSERSIDQSQAGRD